MDEVVISVDVEAPDSTESVEDAEEFSRTSMVLLEFRLFDFVFLHFLLSFVLKVHDSSGSLLDFFLDEEVEPSQCDLDFVDDLRSLLVRFFSASSSIVFPGAGEWMRIRLRVTVDLVFGDGMMINGAGRITTLVASSIVADFFFRGICVHNIEWIYSGRVISLHLRYCSCVTSQADSYLKRDSKV